MTTVTARGPQFRSSKTEDGTPLVALPDPGMSMSQDAEWCVVCENGKWRQIRFHDYHELYALPGLYERIFYDILECDSPRTIRRLFQAELDDSGTSAEELRVLDLGAGNGMVAEELADMGAKHFVGVDIVEEAAHAAERDRPGLYQDYLIVDMTDLEERTHSELADHRFNAMTCVAALGFGDIPTDAFITAYNLVRRGGWIAFNIKEDFLNRKDSSGFAELVHSMIDTGVMEVLRNERYRHRLGTARQPLHYVAFIGRKLKDLD